MRHEFALYGNGLMLAHFPCYETPVKVILRASKVFRGKTYTSPPFQTTTAALADSQNAEHALLRFNVFVEEWVKTVWPKRRKRGA